MLLRLEVSCSAEEKQLCVIVDTVKAITFVNYPQEMLYILE